MTIVNSKSDSLQLYHKFYHSLDDEKKFNALKLEGELYFRNEAKALDLPK